MKINISFDTVERELFFRREEKNSLVSIAYLNIDNIRTCDLYAF